MTWWHNDTTKKAAISAFAVFAGHVPAQGLGLGVGRGRLRYRLGVDQRQARATTATSATSATVKDRR